MVSLCEQLSKLGIWTRLHYVYPYPHVDDVIPLMAEGKILPYLDIPLQHASPRILKLMKRPGSVDRQLARIKQWRKICPELTLRSTFIVGFPGETEEDFLRTMDLVREVGFQQVFTFIYSKREGTPAAKIVDDTPHAVIQDRFDRLVDLVQEGAYVSNQADADRVVEVLFESRNKRDPHSVTGRTPKNQTVHATVPEGCDVESLFGRIGRVKIERARTWYLNGALVSVE